MNLRALALAGTLLAGPVAAMPAATYTADGWLVVEGRLDWSRAEALDAQIAAGRPIAGIEFGTGPGGWLIYATGHVIRHRGLPTRVRPGAEPTSALAMLWLAGPDCRAVAPSAPCRTIGRRAKACFHFPPRGWAAIADTRAYLVAMGLDAGLIAELLDPGRTQVCPDAARWRAQGVRVEN